MVATVHPLATDAGVADGQNPGIGGGSLVLIRTTDGKLIAIDGREMARRKRGTTCL
jgi:gamma-glutamyltranspeptidase/glutathione hydrolase